jgi:hypothetical protein
MQSGDDVKTVIPTSNRPTIREQVSMSDSIQRLCKKCSISYPLTSQFWHKDKSAKEGLSYTCKECAKAKSRKWHGDNQEFANQRSREYYETHLDERRAYIDANFDKIAQQKREWRQNNPELVAAQKKRHYEKHKAKIRAYHREWRMRNMEKMRAYHKQYGIDHAEEISLRTRIWYMKNRLRISELGKLHYQANKERIKANVRDWCKRNPEKVKMHSKVRSQNRRARELAAEGFFTTEDILLAYRSQRGRCWHCGKHVDQKFHADHLIPLKHGGTNWPNNIVCSCSHCNLSKGGKLCYQWNGKLF